MLKNRKAKKQKKTDVGHNIYTAVVKCGGWVVWRNVVRECVYAWSKTQQKQGMHVRQCMQISGVRANATFRFFLYMQSVQPLHTQTHKHMGRIHTQNVN